MTRAAKTGNPSGEVVIVDRWLIQRLLPAIVGDQFDSEDPPWSDAEIARWFASASRRPARQIKSGERKTLFGWKDQTLSGWLFNGGSTSLLGTPGS